MLDLRRQRCDQNILFCWFAVGAAVQRQDVIHLCFNRNEPMLYALVTIVRQLYANQLNVQYSPNFRRLMAERCRGLKVVRVYFQAA